MERFEDFKQFRSRIDESIQNIDHTLEGIIKRIEHLEAQEELMLSIADLVKGDRHDNNKK